MYRFGLKHPLQDIIGLSSPRHSRLNLKYVGTGLGHKPVYTQTKAKKKEREGGEGGREHRDGVVLRETFRRGVSQRENTLTTGTN